MKSHRIRQSASDAALIWIVVVVLLLSVGTLVYKFFAAEDTEEAFGAGSVTAQVAEQNRTNGTSSR